MDYGLANLRGRPDDMACNALLSRAVERDVLRWDTARAYGDAETRIGNFLANCPRRDEIQIISKLPTPPNDLLPAGTLDWVTTQIDTSLRELRIERVAAWLIHDAKTIRTCGNAIWDAMLAQIERGVVERIGLSVYNQNELQLGLDQPDTAAVQLTLNLFDHRFSQSGLLDECALRGIEVDVRSVYLQGVFTMPPEQLPSHVRHLARPLEELHEMLGKYDVTTLDVALPFVLSHQQVDYAVIGVDDVAQLDDNLARAKQRLPAGLVADLRIAFGDLPVDVLEPRRW
jgi:aryl-alcohol dehydrogenase-like predicted oxidoreductase